MTRFAFAIVVMFPILCDACPPLRYCGPGPVVYYQPCPPPCYVACPPCYRGPCCCWRPYPPVQFVQIVEAKAVETVQAQPKKPVDGAPEGWCDIRGRIIWNTASGPVPKRMPIKATKDANVANMDNDFYTEDWVVNPSDYGIKNVVVWLAPEPTANELPLLESRKLKQFPSFKPHDIYPALANPPDATVTLGITCCRFIPHVVVARAGQEFEIRNLSPVPHNGKWISRDNGEFNPLIPPSGQFKLEKALAAERFPIEVACAIHPWMRAFVRVFDHPYFAATDASGNFEIKFAPKGDLRIFIWQEDAGIRGGVAGRLGEKIKVPSGGRLNLGDLKFQKEGQPNR